MDNVNFKTSEREQILMSIAVIEFQISSLSAQKQMLVEKLKTIEKEE